jgi:predicted Rossmann fold nucleotide-binding protein DprA/Smf involved in DNA uptake
LGRCLGAEAPKFIAGLGNLDFLRRKTLALFCSTKCPGNLILQTYDLARALRDKGITVIGGFHSPMEKECLDLLLRGQQPIIISPARSIHERIPTPWRKPIEEDRLLVLSAFGKSVRRPTTESCEYRNRFVAALADVLFVAHAAPGSKTERFLDGIRRWGKPIVTFAGAGVADVVETICRTVQAVKA